MYTQVLAEIQKHANPEKGIFLARFFKTGKGEYAEGDTFLGITVPVQRAIAKKFLNLSLIDIEKLLQSKIHEHRLIALFILISQFKKADTFKKEEIISLYLKNISHINNWDLVDSSAPYILGDYQDKKLLYKFAKSDDLWLRRIAMLATFADIRKNKFTEALKIAEILINDKHDLIHKAVGWMLREMGKKDLTVEKAFLDKHYQTMPRTMLRYAIERFDAKTRKFYLGK